MTNIFKASAVVAAMGLAGVAQAASITYISSTNMGGLAGLVGVTNEVPLTTTNWAQPINVKQFNPGTDGIPLGATLTSVAINYYGTGSFRYGVENTDAGASSASSGPVVMFTNLNFVNGALSVTITPSSSTGSAFTLAPFDGVIDGAGPSGYNLVNGHAGPFGTGGLALFTPAPSDFAAASAQSINNFVVGPLASWIGVGTQAFAVTSNSGKTSSFSGGNINESTTWRAGADMAITYTYTTNNVVPEPATLTLLGAGLMGFGTLRKKRNG